MEELKHECGIVLMRLLKPLSWYQQHQIRRFEIAYVAEAHAGDLLSFYREQDANGAFNVRIVKTGDVEVARAAVLFA